MTHRSSVSQELGVKPTIKSIRVRAKGVNGTVILAHDADSKESRPQYAGEGHVSPLLNAQLLWEQGLVPDALGILLAAKAKGHISPQQIGALIPAEISRDNAKLRTTMRWIIQLLRAINVKIVIGEVHYKKPESQSPETSYSRRSESPSSNRGKLPALFNSTGINYAVSEGPSKEALLEMEEDKEAEGEESKRADSNGEFIPKFIFDSESGVSNPYYRAVKDHKFLKHQDLLELARRWHMHGDYEARNTIVVHNLRLSMKIAAHYVGRGLDYDDLVQEGNIGLMVAAERFNPEPGFHFTTYATWWVRSKITTAIRDQRDTIRSPAHVHEAYNKVLKITCELAAELQREPTLEEVAARAELEIDKVKKILHQLKVPVVSLEELAYSASSKDSDVTIGDHIIDNWFPSAVTALEAKEDLERASLTIRTLLATIKALPISEKAKTAFSMYYGLDGHPEGATLESIAETSGFGVTRERIGQMNAKVWKKLAEFGVSMNDEKLVAAITRVHDLENIVGNEADLSPLTEAMVLNQVSSVFHDSGGNDGELVPADSVTITRRPQANLEKVAPGTLATEDIIRVVGEAYGVTPEIILGDSKPKEVVWVRWVCTYILREKLELSFPKIGQLLHYSEHSVTMYGYRQLVSAMERDPSVKDDIEKIIALCGLRPEKPVDPEQVARAAESANKAASPIVDQVLTFTSQAFEVEKASLFQKFLRSIDPAVARAQSARNFAMYILRTDFAVQCQEVAEIFGISNYGRVSHIHSEVIEKVKTDADLQAKLALIRGQYSLDAYGGNLVQLKQCQKTLFPKQVEEMKSIVEEVVTPFKAKVQRLHAKLEALDVPDRHKEILRLRFNGDPTKETPTYEALGQTYDITRERVRQILVTTMERLTPTLEPSDVDLMVGYTQEFEKVRLVVELQNL
ncbi:MAG: hypothetical protein A2849_04110 [Candidatus Taylorbacteria bacterium RIFCSPHIGHO2_01_FULL_51_15]|uniref:RNA polymerase sigma-70 domain-containing protein n=1 Tax=Candidatus Taylorbacteria bacterium RIFCSPHIGHO2_01_FULL_51_15 TaxID=1802304 RepID=A0A1G2M8X9_9BACT|nr:MAG: hypothetical protein A2849_04110 [Candidatus Taylorbacteria bacterium RIFCSPHIGHO2_01_FULL_51_15]